MRSEHENQHGSRKSIVTKVEPSLYNRARPQRATQRHTSEGLKQARRATSISRGKNADCRERGRKSIPRTRKKRTPSFTQPPFHTYHPLSRHLGAIPPFLLSQNLCTPNSIGIPSSRASLRPYPLANGTGAALAFAPWKRSWRAREGDDSGRRCYILLKSCILLPVHPLWCHLCDERPGF